jgi:glycerophosphoryl diester phosphodiesterase
MENSTSFEALKGGWHLFRGSWKPMAAYALLVWVATLCVLSPLGSWAINQLVAQSGELVVGNSEILNWLLSPKGILTLLLWGALTLLGLLVQVTGLMRIAFEGKQINNWTVRQALHWLQADLYPLFRFCLSAFLLFLLILLPLVVCLVAIYLLLLGAHDINYYLSVKPAEWKWALVLCALSFLLWGPAVCSLLLRWIYALPLWLEGMRPFRATLTASWDTTYRKFFLLLRTTGAYLAVTTGALLILEAFLFMIAGFALSLFDQALQALFLMLSIYLLSAFFLETAIQFIAISWGTCILVILYRDHQTPDKPQKAINYKESRVKNLATSSPHRLLRPWIVLLTMLFVLLSSVVVNAWLLRRKSHGKVPLVIAHRAGALHAPENSLAALEIAIHQGADYAEIDVQRSRDGVVVVIHDADLMKMAREPLVVRETDYAILAQADIGRKYHPDFIGERLARLSDFLEKASGRIKLMIELKYYGEDSELAKEVLRLIHEAGMAEKVSLMSLEISIVRQMQQLAPDIPVGYLSAVGLGRLTSLHVDFLAVSTRDAKSALLRKAERNKIPVYVWTANDIDTMLAMLELGVDGLITDDPALAAEVIHRTNELLPAERLMLRFRHLWDPFTDKSSS